MTTIVDGGGIDRADILAHALEIAEDYRRRDLTLTLRQMYYQFVARGLIGSGQNSYKRIGDVLTEARYDGTFPIHYLLDRGRNVRHGAYTRAAASQDVAGAVTDGRAIVEGLPEFLLQTDRWHGQSNHVSVWVEKEALAGVFEDPCAELGVGWFACKGYPSVSALYDWLKHTYFAHFGVHSTSDHALRERRRYTLGHGFDWTERHEESGADESVVLYFGDHDPDGWEIPRSAERNLRKLMATYGMDVPLRFKRVALNMDQIETYSPPPFEAKVSSARYRGYVDEHATEDAWELDALDPEVLRDLIRAEVSALFDEAIHEENTANDKDVQAELREALAAPLETP